MISQGIDDLSLPVVFKYKNRILLIIGGCVLVFGGWATLCAMVLDAIRHGSGFGFAALITFVNLINSVVFGIAIAGQSDIVIDDQGISRRFFGKKWQTIRWDNVQVIKTFPVGARGFPTKIIRAFTICPTVQPLGISYRSGKIGLTDGFENMEQLIELLNHYVSKYEIKIEVQSNGVTALVTRL